MKLGLSLSAARDFVDRAQFAQTTYFKERRILYSLLISKLESTGEIMLGVEDFYALKGYLDCRNDQISNDSRLSFDKTIVKIEVAIRLNTSGGLVNRALALAVGGQQTQL